MADGSEIPTPPRPAFAHTFQSFAGPLVQPTAIAVLPAVYPDVLRGPPRLAHLLQSFAGPLAQPPAPARPPLAVYPDTLPGPPRLAYTFQSFAAPTANTLNAVGFPGYGSAGAATLALALEPGAKVTYSWGTDIFKSYSGKEQRANTTGPRPRQRFEGSAFLVDSSSRDLRGALQRAASAGSTFLLALPHEELVASADSVANTLTVPTTTLSDWAIVTQRVLVWGVDNSTVQGVIQAVTSTTIRLDVTPGSTGRTGARIMPLIQVLLDPSQGFSRYAVNVDLWSVRALANVFGWVGQDVMGIGSQIVTYSAGGPVNVSSLTDSDLLIWDRPNLIEGTANESMLSLAEVVDLGALPFGIGGAPVPDWARPIKYASASAGEWQWLKAFFRQVLGRQKAFLLSTNRPDLVLVSASGPSLTVESSTVSGGGDYTSWYASQAHRRLALTKTNRTIQYVTVTSLTDNHDGTLTLALDASVSGTVSGISFLEQVRFDNSDSDDFPVVWNGATFSVDLIARTTEETIAASPPPVPQFLAVLWGDSNVEGQGNAQNFGSALEWGVNTAFSPVTIASLNATNTTDPPPFGAEIGPEALQSYAANSTPGFGPEITFMKQLYAISSQFAYAVKCGIIASLLETHWLPTSSYDAAGGGNLYTKQRDRARAYATATGRTISVIFINLGTNDASASGPAGRMSANMTTMVDQLHADFPDAVIVWPLMFVGTGQPFASTVYSQMLSFATTAASTRPYFLMPNIDHLTLAPGDPFHPDTNSVLTWGQIMAFAATDVMGIARPTYGPAPAVAGIGVSQYGGPATTGTFSLSPLGWPGTEDSHTEVLFAVASGVTPGGGASAQTVNTPSGWTVATNGQISAVGFTATWKLMWRNVGAGEIEADPDSPSRDERPVAVTVNFAGSTDNFAKRLTIAGPNPHPSVDTSLSVQPNAFTTGPVSVPSMASSTANGLALFVLGGGVASTPATATLTAAGVTGLTKLAEAYFPMPNSGNQVLVSLWAGTVSSSTGTTSASFSVNTLAFVSGAVFKP